VTSFFFEKGGGIIAANEPTVQLQATNVQSPDPAIQANQKNIQTFQIAVILLGLTALAVVLGGVWLLYTGGNPASLIPIATAAVAGLAGLLTQPGKTQG
jgi:uncharacterized Tic20 family protein